MLARGHFRPTEEPTYSRPRYMQLVQATFLQFEHRNAGMLAQVFQAGFLN